MKRRAMLAVVVYPMAYGVLFGSATAIVLGFFAEAAGSLIPIVVAGSLVLAAPISWPIAPRMSKALSGSRTPRSRER